MGDECSKVAPKERVGSYDKAFNKQALDHLNVSPAMVLESVACAHSLMTTCFITITAYVYNLNCQHEQVCLFFFGCPHAKVLSTHVFTQ